LHRLYFDPVEGFIAWMRHAGRCLGVADDEPVSLLGLAKRGAEQAFEPRDLIGG
jgi:hypothetical protein